MTLRSVSRKGLLKSVKVLDRHVFNFFFFSVMGVYTAQCKSVVKLNPSTIIVRFTY